MLGEKFKMTMIDDVADRTGLRRGTSLQDRRSPGSPTWAEVDRGFWVGSADGVFLGTVERNGPKRFSARDAVRRQVGEYPTPALARAAIIAQMG